MDEYPSSYWMESLLIQASEMLVDGNAPELALKAPLTEEELYGAYDLEISKRFLVEKLRAHLPRDSFEVCKTVNEARQSRPVY